MEHLTPKGMAQFLYRNPQALFIDCRSEMEFRFVGHPVGALHISWNDGPGWESNPRFVDEVKKAAGHDCTRPVALICRSGDRSRDAAKALRAAGLEQVYTVLHGFEGEVGDNYQRGGVNGWRFEGLPWETSTCQNCGS